MKSLNKKNSSHKPKDLLLRSFLIISIICCVFLISDCDQLIDLFGPGNGGGSSRPPEFGGSESESYVTTLFSAVAEGAAGEIAGAPVGWAMSAIGLSDESPDYSAQLNKIDHDLLQISSQLSGIQNTLTQIYNELQIINCTEWQQEASNARSSVEARMLDYTSMIGNQKNSDTLKVPVSAIRTFANMVLGDSVQLNPGVVDMETAITDFGTAMISAGGGGVIPACVQAITQPADNTFGTDTVYYNQVKELVNYYYIYQVEALFLYSEAQHFRAWQNAGSPNSDFVPADSVSYVCSKSSLNCAHVINSTNYVYNNLIAQFTLAGAPYTDSNFVMIYNQQSPRLLPLSLEDFTTAAGDNCASPLTSANPCGITAEFYDVNNVRGVTYKGYTGWFKAGTFILTNLLAGWKSGTAASYLQTEHGFKNMQHKVIISSVSETITLNESGSSQEVIPFIDTDFHYNWFSNDPGEPVQDEFQFQAGVMVKSRSKGSPCGDNSDGTNINVDYKTNPNVPSNRNGFYDAVGHARYCSLHNSYSTTFSFSTKPGWLASQNGNVNHEASARQYSWPVLRIENLQCTENRSNKNAGGVWTMCSDDFTAFLNFNVPRPETCDNPSAGIPCNLTGETVTNAKSLFGNNSKGQKRL